MDAADIVRLLRREMIPAMGCTEPAASALAGAKARELLGEDEIVSVRVSASRDIVKNAMGVGIPDCQMRGILTAVALGVVKGDPSKDLNILSEITPQEVARIADIPLTLTIEENVPQLFIGVEIQGRKHRSKAVISGEHNRFCRLEQDSKVLLDLPLSVAKAYDNDNDSKILLKMTLQDIVSSAEQIPFSELGFVSEAISINLAIARHSLEGEYGLQVGRTQMENLDESDIKDMDEAFRIGACYAAAGSDARMSGCPMPVIINSGSGNQGLTVTLPIYWLGRYLGCTEEKISRAVCVSELVGLVLTARKDRLSALCGAFTASIGTACGYVYLLDGGIRLMDMAIKNMVGNLTGIICDGAKNTCPLKIWSCLEAAALSVKLALKGHAPGKDSGIVGSDSLESIRHLTKISREGMEKTDRTILSIMLGENARIESYSARV